MRIPVRREGKLCWIVLKSTLIVSQEEVSLFVKEKVLEFRLAQKSGCEEIVKEAQALGMIAYLEEKNEKTFDWLFGRGKVKVIRGRKAGYSSRWYEVKDGFIAIKKGINKGFVVDMVEGR